MQTKFSGSTLEVKQLRDMVSIEDEWREEHLSLTFPPRAASPPSLQISPLGGDINM